MKIEVDFTMQYSENISLNEEQILEIVEEYNYNIRLWLKDNMNLLEYAECIDTKIDSIYFDRKEFMKQSEKVLENKKDIIAEKENRIIFDNFLSLKSEKPKDLEQWEDLTKLFNLTKLEIAGKFCDVDNPKFELDYIHINKDYLEATNRQMAIRYILEKGINGKALFQRQFIKALFEGAKLYLSPKKEEKEERTFCLEHNEEYYITPNNFNYADFDFIFPSFDEDDDIKMFQFSKDIFSWTSILDSDGIKAEKRLKLILGGQKLLIIKECEFIFELIEKDLLKIEKIAFKVQNPPILYLVGEDCKIAMTTAVELKVKLKGI